MQDRSNPQPSPPIDDEQTNRAVDEIVASEGDELLAVEDSRIEEERERTETSQPGLGKRFFRAWLGTSKGRWATFLVLFFVLAGIGLNPETRHKLLNAFGVTSSLSLKVIDDSTLQPLKDVQVSIQGKTADTDKNGKVWVDGLRLGPGELTIRKPAFAPVNKPVTIGWGSNPLETFQLEPIGAQYSIVVKDYVSGLPVTYAQASIGEASAVAEDDGVITVTVENPSETLSATITAQSYKPQKIQIDALKPDQEPKVILVPNRKHAFMSKRSGTLDLFKIDIDGTNEELVLKGTGSERGDTTLLVHPFADTAALLSRRGTAVGSDGRVIKSLNIINLKNNDHEIAASSEELELLGWHDNRISYILLDDSQPSDSNEKYRLMSYNYKTGDERELAATNKFNDAVLARGRLYYAPVSAGEDGINQSLFVIDPDGSNSQVVYQGEVTSLIRKSFPNLILSLPDGWLSYELGSDKNPAVSEAPSNFSSKYFAFSQNGSRIIWAEDRGDKGALIQKVIDKPGSKAIVSQKGLTYPLSWIGSRAAIFRIETDTETADYVVGIKGGKPKKIQDVTSVRTLLPE